MIHEFLVPCKILLNTSGQSGKSPNQDRKRFRFYRPPTKSVDPDKGISVTLETPRQVVAEEIAIRHDGKIAEKKEKTNNDSAQGIFIVLNPSNSLTFKAFFPLQRQSLTLIVFALSFPPFVKMASLKTTAKTTLHQH